MTSPHPPARNNYASALVALTVGALSVALYCVMVHFIPLIYLGLILGLIMAFFANMLAYGVVRGSNGFRITITLTGVVLNLVVLWFVYIGLTFDFDRALDALLGGPAQFWAMIQRMALVMSYEFGSLGSSGGFTIQGGVLIALWCLEAVILSLAVIMGHIVATENADTSAKEAMSDSGAMMARGAGAVLIGTVKGLIPVAAVFGGVYLLSEFVF